MRSRARPAEISVRAWRRDAGESAVVTPVAQKGKPSGMDIALLLSDNFAHTLRQVPRPRWLNEFDPEYAW